MVKNRRRHPSSSWSFVTSWLRVHVVVGRRQSKYFDRSSSLVIFVNLSFTIRPVITCFSPAATRRISSSQTFSTIRIQPPPNILRLADSTLYAYSPQSISTASSVNVKSMLLRRQQPHRLLNQRILRLRQNPHKILLRSNPLRAFHPVGNTPATPASDPH